MNSNKQKYYVVWEGNNSGIFNTWDECKLQTKNYTYFTFRYIG